MRTRSRLSKIWLLLILVLVMSVSFSLEREEMLHNGSHRRRHHKPRRYYARITATPRNHPLRHHHPMGLMAEGVRFKRYSYVDSSGVVRYTWVDCCTLPPDTCNYDVQVVPASPRVRPVYGPKTKDWKGLKYGCNCNIRGSEFKSCDIKTGQCRCLPHVVGLTCNMCETGYWGLESGIGCSKCTCDPIGTIGGTCDQTTGKCNCLPGIGGDSCDTCLPNHYGFSKTGCIQCEKCSPGQICDPDTGRCVCPPLAQGPTCRECRPGAWGLIPFKGCKYCNCSTVGSTITQCDPSSGKCTCREGYTGPRCDTCSPLYFGYPRCRPCACHHAGTVSEACEDNGQCQCDNNGQCPCKPNVIGKKCDQCKDGTFGLSALIPTGCTQCFCFGRSSHCTQAGLTWGQIRLNSPRMLTIKYSHPPVPHGPAVKYLSINKFGEHPIDYYSEDEDLELDVVGGVTVIPEVEGNITVGVNYDLPHPLYWKLPEKFNGDRVTSYGGFLKFTIDSSGSSEKISPKTLCQYPLVQIHSHGVLVLEYYEQYSFSSNMQEVPLHETFWKLKSPRNTYRTSPNLDIPIDRATLMVALQNVDGIYVRGTHYSTPTEAILFEAIMDTAIPVRGQPSPLTMSVELCNCPNEYNATSCQEPSSGFYIPPPSWKNISEYVDLIGKAVPCRCNGRSETCDKETGYCTNCRNNTGGKYCDECAEGHYGNINSINGCQPCPCPHEARNHATSCQVVSNRAVCNCKLGYTGADCAMCAAGWWLGNDGKCRQCECNSGGVVRYGDEIPHCHPTTGQCQCRPHVTGMRCDLCITPRHFLQGSQCLACDNCSQTLLDDIELLTYEMERDTEHIKNSSIPKPWVILYQISNTSKRLDQTLDNALKVLDRIINSPIDRFVDKEASADILENSANRLVRKWNETLPKTHKIKEDALAVFDNLSLLRSKLEDRIRELEDFSRHERHVNVKKAIKEANNLLKKIKDIELSQHLKNAFKIFELANLRSTVVDEYIYKLRDHENKIKNFKDRYEIWENKIDEINSFKENIWDKMDETENLIPRLRNRHNDVQEKHVQISALAEDINKIRENRLNDETEVFFQECQDDILNLKMVIPFLKNLTDETERKAEILRRINLDYVDAYLIPAQKHASNLTKIAESYKNLFAQTKNNTFSAVKASSVYKNIASKIYAAKEAALKALDSSESAAKTANEGFNSLLQSSEISKQNSDVYLAKAKHSQSKVKDLSSDFEKSRQKVERIRISIKNIAWKDKDINEFSSNISTSNILNNLAIGNNKSEKVFENMRALNEETNSIISHIRYKLKMKLDDMKKYGDYKIGDAEEKLSLLRGNIKRSKELASGLMDAVQLREMEINKSNSSLSEKIQLLKDRIQRAKHIADGIRVSMQSSKSQACYRSYQAVNLTPSATTKIVITLSLSPENSKDSILFHLASSKRSDFVKMELLNGKIKFSWNLGGNTAYILHPEVLETSKDPSSDYSWYKIIAERIWNIGTLTVKKVVPDGNPPISVTNSSDPTWGTLNVKSDDLIWIGNSGSRNSNSNGTPGCIHYISFNGMPIGLWNFNSEPIPGGCVGCIESPQEIALTEQNVFYWNGAGYSVLTRSEFRAYNKNQFSIFFTFRTFDENALLFLTIDEANNRSISLELKDGKVIFRINYAGESRLEINTTEKYNTGKFVQVQAARIFMKKVEKGSLKVDGKEYLGSPNPPVISALSLPDLVDSKYYIGGTPPLWRPSLYSSSVPPSFLGCLGDITIDQEGYDPLDTSAFYGVEKSCSEKMLSLVGFYGDGFLELPSHTLRRKSSIGLLFRTVQPDAFLLLSAPHSYLSTKNVDAQTTETNIFEDDGYYSLSLVKGRIHLLMNAGRGEMKLISNSTNLNDGLFHSVNIVKNGRKIVLFIDDVLQSSASLPSGAGTVHAPPNGGLFIGGIPEHLNQTDITNQHVGSTIPLFGAIKDIVFDENVISMNTLLMMKHALLGRMGPSMGEENEDGANLLNTQQLETSLNRSARGCHKVYSYTLEPGAVKFGDVTNSYSQIHPTIRNIWQKDFFLEFDFRTFYPNGLLLVSPGTREKQQHAISIFLRDGKITLQLKARRKREIQIPTVTNNGEWHRVMVRTNQRKLSISLGSKGQKTGMPKKISLRSMFYVGGIPEKSKLNIPEQLAKIEGFKGCIKRFSINGKPEDLVKDAALHQNVGQCFPSIERGSYFPGDAYVVYKKHFVIGSHLELQLEFRTVEMNGVLMSIAPSNANTPSLSLELHNAVVVMSVQTYTGKRFRVEASLPTQFGLCDNTWHNISALFTDRELTVRIDQQPEKNSFGSSFSEEMGPQSINQPLVQTPLYIGGLPDGVPTGTLTTKDNFKGCIRNVSIRGQMKDWTDMDYLHNLLLSSCPVQ